MKKIFDKYKEGSHGLHFCFCNKSFAPLLLQNENRKKKNTVIVMKSER